VDQFIISGVELPLLNATPCVNDVTTPDISIVSENDLESELLNKSNKLQTENTKEGRPSTQIFIQNTVYTYASLPSTAQHKCINESKKAIKEGVMSLENNMNPNAQLLMPMIGDIRNDATI